jgi:hypothetical protein
LLLLQVLADPVLQSLQQRMEQLTNYFTAEEIAATP